MAIWMMSCRAIRVKDSGTFTRRQIFGAMP
jgi:hypothetical protein